MFSNNTFPYATDFKALDRAISITIQQICNVPFLELSHFFYIAQCLKESLNSALHVLGFRSENKGVIVAGHYAILTNLYKQLNIKKHKGTITIHKEKTSQYKGKITNLILLL